MSIFTYDSTTKVYLRVIRSVDDLVESEGWTTKMCPTANATFDEVADEWVPDPAIVAAALSSQIEAYRTAAAERVNTYVAGLFTLNTGVDSVYKVMAYVYKKFESNDITDDDRVANALPEHYHGKLAKNRHTTKKHPAHEKEAARKGKTKLQLAQEVETQGDNTHEYIGALEEVRTYYKDKILDPVQCPDIATIDATYAAFLVEADAITFGV